MNSLRARIIDRRIIQKTILQYQSVSSSTSTNPSEIQIPIRKERGPTDILQALETTIARDPTAPNYKFIDDPYLIPNSINKKRAYALAKESGKKAAFWVLQEHADLLRSEQSEPLIEAFLPLDKYENKDQVSEEILFKLIKQTRVSDALHVYNLLEDKASNEAKQAVLEMLCYYNSKTDQISENYPEERSFQVENEITKNVWINNDVIENIFGELIQNEETAAGAYNALICGTAKYLKSDRAWKLYNECVEKKIPLDVTTYNYLIQLSPLIKDNSEDRKILIISLLQSMAKNGIKPDIRTLNSALKSISTFQPITSAKDLSLSLLAEFKSIGIEPSLASYHYILVIFNQTNDPSNMILLEILDNLEKQEELKLQDFMDNNFFVHAMEIANTHMHDINAGDRLHKLLMTKKNYVFIGDRLKESVYYRNYLQLILTSTDIDNFLEVYDLLVPHVYIPEPALMKDILQMLEFTEKEKATEMLSKFLPQIVTYDMLDRHQIVSIVFHMMTGHCSPPENSPLHKQYADMAWTLWTYLQEMNEKRLHRTIWPSNILGNVAVVLLRNGEFERMLEIVNYITKSKNFLYGTVHSRKLEEIFNACIARGHTAGALTVIEYAVDKDNNLINKMISDVTSLPLSETQEKFLINLVGEDAFTRNK